MTRNSKRISIQILLLLGSINLFTPTRVQANPSSESSSWVKPAAIALVAAGGWYLRDAYKHHTPLKWDWDAIGDDVNKTEFPSDFDWGASTSSQQIEGSQSCNSWWLWERYKEKIGDPDFVPAGQACDFWNDHRPFIDMLKKAGLNSFRMSLEWARIEPEQGKFDQAALDHYKEICKDFSDAGIKLFVTLHHYTEPLWFSDTDYDHGQEITPGLGGFSKQENVQYFARYAQRVFQELHQYVYRWATFNNLTSYASKAYHARLLPPAKKDMQLWQQTQANMLEAHVQAYQAIKAIGVESLVGIMHNVFHLEPARPWHPVDRLAVHMGNLLTRDGVYSFFKTGRYKAWIPTKVSVDHSNPEAPRSLDWVGCNNYSHAYMKNFDVVRNPDETPVDNPRYTVYPEGMYRAIKEVSEHIAKPCGDIPIVVTENGVSTPDEQTRKTFFARYIYAIDRARKDGCKVTGYSPWSLVDNYEWGSYRKSYGLFSYADRQNPNSPVTIHPGVNPVLEAMRRALSKHK